MVLLDIMNRSNVSWRHDQAFGFVLHTFPSSLPFLVHGHVYIYIHIYIYMYGMICCQGQTTNLKSFVSG